MHVNKTKELRGARPGRFNQKARKMLITIGLHVIKWSHTVKDEERQFDQRTTTR